MSIQNVIRSKDLCTPIYRGTLGTPTSAITSDTTGDKGMSPTCHKGSVWFQGKLFAFHRLGGQYWWLKSYNTSTGIWSAVAGTHYISTQDGHCSLPNLIVYKDKICAFYDYGEPVNYSYNTHTLRKAWWDMTSSYTSTAGQYAVAYDKNVSPYQDLNHVHDSIIYQGIFYLACSYGIYTNNPADTIISKYWEISETGTNGFPLADLQVAKKLSAFGNSLYCLFANGTVNLLGGIMSEEEDLNNVITDGSGIITGVDLTGTITDSSIGYGCYIFQANDQIHAFLNASGTDGSGIVSFSSTNGTNWSQTTQDVVPLEWRSQVGHIQGCSDIAADEHRIIFLNATIGTSFNEYVFNGSGTELTSLGSPAVADFLCYNFWNDTAIDVESENEPVIDLSTVTATYKLYNESSGIADIAPKYSIDNGGSWHDATRKAGMGSGLTNLPSETFANGGKEYVFIWDYRTDLGYSEDYTNVKLQFITSVV